MSRERRLAAPRAEIRRLTKRYGDRTALHKVDLLLPPACFVALLGPNGAGKSTLFQILTGLFAADEGDVTVDGASLRESPVAALRQIGVVFQQMSLDLDLSVRGNLQFHCELQGLPRALAAQRIEQAARRFGLYDDLGRRTRELSGGNRRKVELARALLHHPALLLMDEPTVGLDPQSRRDLLTAIRGDIAQRGTTVLWATHLVQEAASADRVVMLHRGRVLADAAPSAVVERLGGGSLEECFIRATTGPTT